jgi:hypothetical protein
LENQNAKYLGAPVIFTILGNRTSKGSDNKPDLDKHKYYKYSCKGSKIYKHKWDLLSYITMEIAITELSKT